MLVFGVGFFFYDSENKNHNISMAIYQSAIFFHIINWAFCILSHIYRSFSSDSPFPIEKMFFICHKKIAEVTLESLPNQHFHYISLAVYILWVCFLFGLSNYINIFNYIYSCVCMYVKRAREQYFPFFSICYEKKRS